MEDAAVTAEVALAEVIAEDENDVWLSGRGMGAAKDQQGERCDYGFHGDGFISVWGW